MAVYTHITESELEDFLSTFSIGELVEYKGITSGVENTNYFVTTTQATFILTIFEKRVDKNDLPFFLNLMNHLHAKGINCPQVIANTKGDTLQSITGKSAIIISFLKGAEINAVTQNSCYQVGKCVAQLHLAVKDFPHTRKNALALNGWQDLYDILAPHMPNDLQAFISNELAYQHANKHTKLETGIVHADLFTDNIFFDGDTLTGVIDFYFSATDSFAYDLAITMTAWCFGNNFDAINTEYAIAMIKGYNSLRPLSPEEKNALPTLARGAALRFLLTRYYDEIHTPAGADVVVKDHTEYLRKLKFYQSLNFTSSGII